jgi:hypothetical protein
MFNPRLTRIALALVAATAFAAASVSASTPRGVAPDVKVVPPFNPPTLTPKAGTYTAPQTVTIADGVTGAVFYYTTNGTTPTAASTRYTGPISVSKTETIRVIAVASGRTSTVGTNVYTIK